ncbi:MAG: FtsX-like permease family protein [Clostridia bacterium]|nr:FtsX-like permease family protein [Clostridia bacterium]
MTKLNLRLLRTIKHTLGQYIAVSLVIIIGIMSYVGFSMAMVNLETTVSAYKQATNAADIYVELNRIPANALKFLYDIDGIVDIQGRVKSDIAYTNEDGVRGTLRVVSVPEDQDRAIHNLYIREGSFVRGNRGVMVVQTYAQANGIEIGDAMDVQINGKTYRLTVEGIVSSSEFVYVIENEQTLLPDNEKFGIIFLEESFAQKAFGYDNSYNDLLIKVEDEEQIDGIVDTLEKKLKRYGASRVISHKDQLSNRMVEEEIKQGKNSARTVPFIFLIAAAAIIVTMITKIVRNDRMAIGILKAMGYNNRQLMIHYSMYSMGIGVIGGTLGIYFGMQVAELFARMYVEYSFDVPMLVGNFYIEYIFAGMFMTVIFCVGAGIFGSRRIMKIHPAESMRPDAPKVGRSIFLERVRILWKHISFSWKIVLKNIFRSKKRFVFLVMGIALTYAITVFPLYQFVAMDEVFLLHYSEFQKMDYNVNFLKPMNEHTLYDIKGVIDTSDIEGKIEFPFKIEHKWKSKIINIIGVKPDTVFYNFVDAENRPLKVPNEGMLLSEGLAKIMGIHVGDKLLVKTFVPERDDQWVEVTGLVKQNLGSNAYMDIDYMQKAFMDDQLITGVYIDSTDDVKSTLDDMKYVGSIQSVVDMKEGFLQFMDVFYMSISLMIIFAGILGFAIIYNSTIISMNERQLEFSSLRVMGFTKNEIFKTVVYENIIMTLFGIAVGIPVASSMLNGIGEALTTEFYSLNIKIPAAIFFYGGIITIIFVIIAQLATYGRLHRLNFIDALKNRTT